MMAFIRRSFISGLLVWVPIWVTILVINFLINILNNTLLLLPRQYHPDMLLGFHFPGMGILITLLVILCTGAVAANFIGSRLVAVWDNLIGRIPLIRSIHTGVKQVMQTLFTPGGQSFRKVVLIEYPRTGVWTVAFLTGEAPKEMGPILQESNLVSVFVPTTPNPTGGFLLLIPREKVKEVDISVDQALKYVISLGVVHPDMNGNGKKLKSEKKA